VGAKIIKPEITVKALKAEIKKEVMSELCQSEVKPGGGTPASTTNEGKKNPNIICFTCKEKGHISSNCPKKGTATDGGGKGGGKDKNQVTNPYKMKPKDGKSLIKTINGQE